MGKSAPAPPDFKGAAEATAQSSQNAINAQTQANRPNINTGFGSESWSKDPNGNWTMNTALAPGLQGGLESLQGQFQSANANPLDFSKFAPVGTGDSAREQAISAAYGQATSRLDPRFNLEQQHLQSQLANQGLDPNSQAYRSAMTQFGQGKNDAYTSAMNSAIGQGTSAGQALFNQNLTARQQAIQEALTGRQLPLQQLAALHGFQQMPGFNMAGAAQPANYLGASEALWNGQLQQAQSQNSMLGQIFGLGGQLGAAALMGPLGGGATTGAGRIAV